MSLGANNHDVEVTVFKCRQLIRINKAQNIDFFVLNIDGLYIKYLYINDYNSKNINIKA